MVLEQKMNVYVMGNIYKYLIDDQKLQKL